MDHVPAKPVHLRSYILVQAEYQSSETGCLLYQEVWYNKGFLWETSHDKNPFDIRNLAAGYLGLDNVLDCEGHLGD